MGILSSDMDDLDHTHTTWLVRHFGMDPQEWLTDPTNTIKRTRRGHLPCLGYKKVIEQMQAEFESMRISDITPQNIEKLLRKYIRRIDRDRFTFYTKEAAGKHGPYTYYELSRKFTPYTPPFGLRCRPFIPNNDVDI